MYSKDLLVLLFASLLTNFTIDSFVSILKSSPAVDIEGLWSPSLRTKAIYGNLTLSHRGSLNVPTPCYAQILSEGILSVTSFSLLRKGSIMQFDLNDQFSHKTLRGDYLWPNELSRFNHTDGTEVLLVPDGFLMPGQSDGGLYAIIDPNSPNRHPIRITNHKNGWFYHRAVYVKLPEGKQGIITARARKPLIGKGEGELVWITVPDRLDNLEYQQRRDLKRYGNRVEKFWDELVLASGPDVMFEVLDGNRSDKTIDIVAAQFFNEKLSIHTIRAIDQYPHVEVVKSSTIKTIGKPYGLSLAKFNDQNDPRPSHLLVSTHECSYDIPSTIDMAISAFTGIFPRILSGYRRRGVRDGDRVPVENGRNSDSVNQGGSLYSYRILTGAFQQDYDQDIKNWKRSTLFRGFKVRGWGGIFSPGAPGFPYVVRRPNSEETLILLAGDCTGSAYIFAPQRTDFKTSTSIDLSRDVSFSDSDDHANQKNGNEEEEESFPEYDLAFEIECGATVGSLACQTNADQTLDIFIPSYELNKIHIFRLDEIQRK